MTPSYKIIADGADISANFRGRLMELSITDQRGYESDTLDLTLDDTDAGIMWPRRGAELRVYLGYAEAPALFDMGKWVVDEIQHSGPPDKVQIHTKAPDILAAFKGAKTRAWDKTTLGAILDTIASDNKLKPAVSAAMKAQKVDHFDQTQESDLNVLTRLGERYGAVAKIADGRLVFTEAGKAKTASGAAMPLIALTRQDIDSHTYAEKGRGDYTGVEAVWHDVRAAKKRKATASAAKKPKKKTTRTVLPPKMVVSNEEETAGSADNVKRLKQTFPDEATAKAAAAAEWQRLQRDKGTLDLDLKMGRPDFRAEVRVKLSGIRPWVDGDWVVVECSHSLSASSGLSTRLRLERPDDFAADNE